MIECIHTAGSPHVCTFPNWAVPKAAESQRESAVKQWLHIVSAGKVQNVTKMCEKCALVLCLFCTWHSLVSSGASLASSSLKYPPLAPNPMHVHSGWHLQRRVDGRCVSLSNYYISLTFCCFVVVLPKTMS